MPEVPSVLEIPPAGAVTTPSRETTFRNATRYGGGNLTQRMKDLLCDCGPGGSQGPYNPAQQHQPPFSNQGLGQPVTPQKPFEPVGQDPCAGAQDALAKQGIDIDCLRQLMQRGRATPRRAAPRTRKAKSRSRKARGYLYSKADIERIYGPGTYEILRQDPGQPGGGTRRRRAKSTKRRAPRGSGPAGSQGYRVLANGTCYDVAAKRFVSQSKCNRVRR